MDRTLSNTRKQYLRNVVAFGAAVLMALSSCSAKSSIKELIGHPLHSQQDAPENHPASISTAFQQCSQGEFKKTQISSVLFSLERVSPTAMAGSTFISVTSGRTSLEKAQSHPLYKSKRIPSPIPLFLQYQHFKFHIG